MKQEAPTSISRGSSPKGVRGEQKLPTGKIFGFKKFDKVEYLGETCFIKARRSSGAFVLMDIDNNSIDFRDRGGKQNPSYMSIKRITMRESVLCISKRIEKERQKIEFDIENYKNLLRESEEKLRELTTKEGEK